MIMNKIFLGLSIALLKISKTGVMYEFWYNYVKQKFGEKANIMLHGY